MDAVGLGVGIVALFNTCVDGFKIVFAAQSFARDFEILNTAFDQQRLRFILWGKLGYTHSLCSWIFFSSNASSVCNASLKSAIKASQRDLVKSSRTTTRNIFIFSECGAMV